MNRCEGPVDPENSCSGQGAPSQVACNENCDVALAAEVSVYFPDQRTDERTNWWVDGLVGSWEVAPWSVRRGRSVIDSAIIKIPAAPNLPTVDDICCGCSSKVTGAPRFCLSGQMGDNPATNPLSESRYWRDESGRSLGLGGPDRNVEGRISKMRTIIDVQRASVDSRA